MRRNAGAPVRLIARSPARVEDTGDVLLVRFGLRAGDRFDDHEHPYHQLAWAPDGLLVARAGGRRWSLPASVALWIPAGERHEVEAARSCEVQNVYVRVPSCPIDWPEPTVVAVTPLVDALVHRLVDDGLGPDERARAEAVLWDNMFPVTGAGFALRLPADPRARDVADALLADPADARTLDGWGAEVGASRATLARHFVQDTGLSFARWRTQARVQAALDHLAAGLPVQAVARRVGYTDTSSFIATFRRATGRTPARWTARPPGP